MQRAALGALAVALPALLGACVNGRIDPQQASWRVDPQQATERAAAGAVLGAALGTGLGATFAIDPGLGAVIGAESGGAVGAAIGVATSDPLPSYKPIPVPAEAVIPSFYDGWAPGFLAPPGNPETQSPHAG